MSGLLSRFTTFLPNATILSNDHNQELNRIVNLLNGTTTNLKTVLKTSDAGDPPLELDQLSTGPIQKWFQGGILKASVTNDGSLSTTGNLLINNANPTVTFDDTAGTDAKIDLDASILRFGSVAANQVTLDVSTGIMSFIQIPVLPASNPTTANQAARKQYVDDTKVAFSIAFNIEDPTQPTVGVLISGTRVPEGTAITVTKVGVHWLNGSHTSGGSITFNVQRRTAASGWAAATDLGGVVLDNTNNAQFNVYTNDIADLPLGQNDILSVWIQARSGTITERTVVVSVIGTQQRI